MAALTWDELFYDYVIKETGKSGGRYVAAAGGFTVHNCQRLFTKPGALSWIEVHQGDYIILRS